MAAKKRHTERWLHWTVEKEQIHQTLSIRRDQERTHQKEVQGPSLDVNVVRHVQDEDVGRASRADQCAQQRCARREQQQSSYDFSAAGEELIAARRTDRGP